MPDRRWYRSLYARIAVGYIALLVVLLIAQTTLSVWLTNRMWGRTQRTPAQLAQQVATELTEQLSADPGLDVHAYVRRQFASGYQPFVLAFTDGRTASNRPSAIPPTLPADAGAHLAGHPETFRGPPAVYGDIQVRGTVIGTVAVPQTPPPTFISVQELAPTLAMIAFGLVVIGVGLASYAIFGPAHRRLRTLERAAVALGEGRTDVRADEAGGDEVSGLSRTFNRMASELAARTEALSRSDRARRQLLADVSHELMTPLSAIRGYTETLAMPEVVLDDPARRRYLGIVEEETQRLEAIIGDLLDLARLEGDASPLVCAAVAADDLFRRVEARHMPSLRERHVTLATAIAPATPALWGNANRLEQALQNLAANAIRHTPPGGSVTLTAAPATGDRVLLRVADTGPGIPADHLPFVFDRFYKADASRAGTVVPSGSGLGLSIVRAIAERHRGEVSARNTPGGGAILELLIPAAGSAMAAGASAATAPSSDRDTRRVG